MDSSVSTIAAMSAGLGCSGTPGKRAFTALSLPVTNTNGTPHDVQKRSVDAVRCLNEPQTLFNGCDWREWHSSQGFEVLNHFERQKRFVLNHKNMQPLEGVVRPFLLSSAHRLLSGWPRSDQNGNEMTL